jgi:ribosomal protein L11 methyltransferase
MPFLQLTLDVGARDPEPYEDALFAFGAVAVTLLDAADDPVLEPAPGAMPLWPTVVVRALFAGDVDAAALCTALAATPGLDAARIDQHVRVETVADRAWEREWLKDFRPMRFGRRLWICPGGQVPEGVLQDDTDPAVLVELDPGLAFGTGTHPTTAMCLEWLDSGTGSWLDRARVIDYGSGSGILAVAALKLGAQAAVAMDIDPQALLASRENAQRNAVDACLTVTADPGCDGVVADVLVANILAAPLVELAPRLAERVRAGGRIALSGLLLEQAERVTAAYRPWFDIALAAARDEWALLAGQRRE